jgi:UDP-glucose 4-epimerase
MRFLLLGGIGYLGGRLAGHLKAQGHVVYITTRRPPAEVPAWVCADRIVQWDGHTAELRPLLEDADVAVHLAAADQEAAAQDPARAFQTSAATAWWLMQAAAGCAGPPVVIYVSTFHVYGRMSGDITETTPAAPVHPYALAKRFGEEVIELFRRNRSAPALCVRLANAFGCPAGREVSQWTLAFNDFCRQAAAQNTIMLKSAGTQRRNFITLGDAVRALEFLAARPADWPADGILHMGSRLSYSIWEAAELVAERAAEMWGVRPEIQAPAASGGGAPAEFTFHSARLAALGFTWTNAVEAEVDATLRLCASAFGRHPS